MHINDILDLPNLQAVIARFEEKFVRLGEDDCWEWTAGKDSRGYGGVTINLTAFGAHRVAYLLANGPLPAIEGYHGACVLHKCDNPGCVNPHHLFFGTAGENNSDTAAKDRTRYGSDNPASKLTEADVRAILKDPRRPDDIAAAYGVHRTNVYRILRGDSWRRLNYRE